jgi:hypothetical protein
MHSSFIRLAVLALVSALVAGGMTWGTASASSSNTPVSAEPAPAADATLHDAMRKLWEDHITWTRLAIIDIADNAPSQASTVDRLLQNQVDIGNAIKPYYGERAGSQLTALLHDHITIAADLVQAAKADDMAMVDALNRKWQGNADDISMFLSQANPVYWKFSEIRREMHNHLDLTLKEAALYIKGDYDGSVAMYDKVHEQILGMADMLSMGIEAQFPERFTDTSNVATMPHTHTGETGGAPSSTSSAGTGMSPSGGGY